MIEEELFDQYGHDIVAELLPVFVVIDDIFNRFAVRDFFERFSIKNQPTKAQHSFSFHSALPREGGLFLRKVF